MQPGRPTEPTSFASWKFTRQGAAVSVMPYPWMKVMPSNPLKKCARSALSGAPPQASHFMLGPRAERIDEPTVCM